MHTFAAALQGYHWLLLAGFILSSLFVMFAKKIADVLFSPKPNGHPAANVFRLIAYFMTWIFAPIAMAVVAIACLIGFVAAL